MNKPRPLEGLTVIDMTLALAGPFATFLLAGLGAKVIKVENPDGGDHCRSNAPYLGRNGASLIKEFDDDISISALNRLRNKESITLNLKHPKAQTIYADLIKKADIVVENFSKGTLDRLGVGYAFAKENNSRIIYCAISGFGNDSPGDGKAMDAIIQALSGTMMTSGAENDPPIRVGVPFADMSAPMFGVMGILAALHQLQRTGEGQYVDISMLGALSMMVACEPFDILERCGIPQRTGQTVPRLAPFGIFPTKTGFVAICAPTEIFAKSFFKAIKKEELSQDKRFKTRDLRVKNEATLNQIIEEFTRSHSTNEVIEALELVGVPCAEVRTPSEGVRDPRLISRGETVALEHPKYGKTDDVMGMGMPIKLSESTVGFDKPAPDLGEHNEEIYAEFLGYSQEKIKELKGNKII